MKKGYFFIFQKSSPIFINHKNSLKNIHTYLEINKLFSIQTARVYATVAAPIFTNSIVGKKNRKYCDKEFWKNKILHWFCKLHPQTLYFFNGILHVFSMKSHKFVNLCDWIFAHCDLYSLPSGGPMIPFPECIGFRLVFYTHRNAVNVTKKITNYFSHCVFKKLILLQKFRDIEIFPDT